MARAQFSAETSGGGAFVRQPNRFTGRVTADSTSPPGGGPDEQDRWPLEAGRYRLIWCRACPWAHRARIVRGLLGLDDAISLGTVDPIRDERGWAFALDPDGFDPVLGVSFLSEAYLATDPDYTGRVTVPALVDTLTGRVITNDYPQLTLDLSTEWRSLHRAGRAGPLPGGAAPGDGRADGRDPHRREQRRLPVRVRHLPAGVRRGVPGALRPAGRALRAAGRAALPDGRRDHRGGRAAVHHAGPLRRRVPRALQVQPAAS